MQQRPPSGRGEVSILLQARLNAMAGATGAPMTASRGSIPLVLIYKVMGKMFAILALRGEDNVILKCDPQLAEILREKYQGVGHRSHLDRRIWISVDLKSDVPSEEIWRLVTQSYALVCESLTRKQKADLIALGEHGDGA